MTMNLNFLQQQAVKKDIETSGNLASAKNAETAGTLAHNSSLFFNAPQAAPVAVNSASNGGLNLVC